MALKIMNWNIEQFGATRSQEKDRLHWVSVEIDHYEPDICVIVEMKTKFPSTAIEICDRLHGAIIKQKKKLDYNYVICYHNGIEVFCFLYKASKVNPIVLEKLERKVYNKKGNPALTDLTFKEVNAFNSKVKDGIIEGHCPLFFSPGQTTQRPHVIAFFKELNTNRFFGIVAVHCDLKCPEALTDDLSQTKFIKDRTIEINYKNINNVTGKKDVDNLIITGDFNTDIIKDSQYYDGFKNNQYTITITGKTHIREYKTKNKDVSDPGELLNFGIDNLIVTPVTNNHNSHIANLVDELNIVKGKVRTYYMDKSEIKSAKYLISFRLIKSHCGQVIRKIKTQGKPYIKVKDFRAMLEENKNANFWNITSQKALDKAFAKTKQILGDTRYEVQFSNPAWEYIEGQLYFITERVGPIILGENNMKVNDAVFFARAWMSDHSPVMMDF